MNLGKSHGHICFSGGYEYFWCKDSAGQPIVVKAATSNSFDERAKQRVGARFEGTAAWYQHFGETLFPAATDASRTLS